MFHARPKLERLALEYNAAIIADNEAKAERAEKRAEVLAYIDGNELRNARGGYQYPLKGVGRLVLSQRGRKLVTFEDVLEHDRALAYKLAKISFTDLEKANKALALAIVKEGRPTDVLEIRK